MIGKDKFQIPNHSNGRIIDLMVNWSSYIIKNDAPNKTNHFTENLIYLREKESSWYIPDISWWKSGYSVLTFKVNNVKHGKC